MIFLHFLHFTLFKKIFNMYKSFRIVIRKILNLPTLNHYIQQQQQLYINHIKLIFSYLDNHHEITIY